MNHEHVSLQMHLNTFVPGIMRAVSDGIDRYLDMVHKRSLETATIIITDDTEFASKAIETNDIIILLSSKPEMVISKIVVSEPDRKSIVHAVYQACIDAFCQT